MRIHVPSITCDIISFTGQRQLCPLACAEWRHLSNPYQNEHNSVKDTGEKGKKTCNIDLKIAMKILFHYPPTFPFFSLWDLKSFPKKFSHQNEAYSMPRKKIKARKAKKEGGEKVKRESQDCAFQNFANWKFASGSEVREVSTCKWLFVARQWPEKCSTSFICLKKLILH